MGYFIGKMFLLQYTYMRRFGLLAGLLLYCCSASSQIYRVNEKSVFSKESVRTESWEISGGVFASTASLHSLEEERVFGGDIGFSARLLYALNRWAALGVEGSFSREESAAFVIEQYRVWRLGAAGKFTLTAGTNPQVYVLLGAGVISRKLQTLYFLADETMTGYVTVGWGIEARTASGWFGALELYGAYDKAPRLNRYFYVPHRWTAGAQLRFGLHF